MQRNIFGAPKPIWQYSPKTNSISHYALKGADVEHAVATTVNLFVYEYPGVSVFHGAALAANGTGEVDSILIYRDHVILVEAKSTTQSSAVFFSPRGGLLRRANVHDPEGKVRTYKGNQLSKKIDRYRKRFPDLKFSGVYVFYGSSHITTANRGRRTITTFDDLSQTLRKRLDKSGSLPLSAKVEAQVASLSEVLKESQQAVNLSAYGKKLLKENPVLAVDLYGAGAVRTEKTTFWEKVADTYRIWVH